MSARRRAAAALCGGVVAGVLAGAGRAAPAQGGHGAADTLGGPADTPAGPLAVTRVTVVDVARGRLVPDQTLVVRGDTVVRAGPAARVPVPAGARVVDGRGRFVIPGLWDMGSLVLQGVRTTVPGALALVLAHGVTGTRDLNTGMPLDSAARIAREVEAGARVGPRLVWTGPALQQSIPAGSPNFVRVDSLADALALVGRMADAGAHHVRLVQGFREADAPAVVAAARARGLPVTVAPVFGWDSATALGVAGIEHFADLKRTTAVAPLRARYRMLYRDETRRPPRAVVQPFLDSLDQFPDTAYRRAVLAAVARAGVPVTTNMATMFWAQAMLADRYAARARWVRADAPRAPEVAPGNTASPAAAAAVWRDLRALRDAGVPLLAGSLGGQGRAAVPGAALHDELELMVRAGLTPREALASATVTAAAVVARLYPRVRAAGAVAAGAPADLVLLDGDPLADVANVRRVRAVVARGRLYDRAALDTLLDGAARLAAGAGSTSSPDSAAAADAAGRFLEAFDGMDDARFAAAWAADATVFMPDARQPRRFEGRDPVLAYFQTMFADARGRGVGSLRVRERVRDLRVVLLAPGAAVVTFHLGDDPAPGRRSVVWRREGDGVWRIVHLHASRIAPP